MGFYERFRPSETGKPEGIHPVWRGIGFILMGLIAVMSYAGANLLVEANKTRGWIAVPPAIQGGVPWAPDLYAELIVSFFLALFGFALVTVIYSLFYQMIRPKDPLKK